MFPAGANFNSLASERELRIVRIDYEYADSLSNREISRIATALPPWYCFWRAADQDSRGSGAGARLVASGFVLPD